jgi:hypothetical protein
MEKKEITTINPVSVGGINIIPVSRATVRSRRGKKYVAFSGTKQPDAIIIVTPSGKKAFRIDGEELTLDQLEAEFPGMVNKLEEV